MTALVLTGCPACTSDHDQAPALKAPEFTVVPPLPLPKDCDDPLPTADLGDHDDPYHLFGLGMRALGDTIYFAYPDGVYALDVPGGEKRLIVPSPPAPGSSSEADGGMSDAGASSRAFDEIWVDETKILAVSDGALFRAPRTGGSAVRLTTAREGLPGGQFTKFGDSVYYAAFGRRWELWRLPVSGGPAVVMKGGDSLEHASLLAGPSTLFYDQGFGPWGSIAVDGDEATVTQLGEGEVMGADEFAYVATQGPPELTVPWHLHKWLIQKMNPAGERQGEGAALPTNVDIQGATLHPRLVTFEGARYFVAGATYQLPDDKRTEDRPVLMRYSPDSDSVELVRCIPPPPFDPLLPGGGQIAEVTDIAATDTGVFVLRRRDAIANHLARTAPWAPQAVKVWP